MIAGPSQLFVVPKKVFVPLSCHVGRKTYRWGWTESSMPWPVHARAEASTSASV